MGHLLEVSDLAQSSGALLGKAPLLFEGINLRWEAPSVQVIMGASGSGKSSLLRSLGGVWKPRHGHVKLDGEKLWLGEQLNPRLLSRIGFAFQNNALFNSLRCVENVAFAHRQLHPETSEIDRQALAHDWLKKVGLDHVPYQFPHEISGGMQKRLGLARTLILKPDFIFLDDPTAGLDPITSRQMAELVAKLLEGSESLVIIVTNDPDRARDWGPHIHYLYERKLYSPGSSPRYGELQELFA